MQQINLLLSNEPGESLECSDINPSFALQIQVRDTGREALRERTALAGRAEAAPQPAFGEMIGIVHRYGFQPSQLQRIHHLHYIIHATRSGYMTSLLVRGARLSTP